MGDPQNHLFYGGYSDGHPWLGWSGVPPWLRKPSFGDMIINIWYIMIMVYYGDIYIYSPNDIPYPQIYGILWYIYGVCMYIYIWMIIYDYIWLYMIYDDIRIIISQMIFQSSKIAEALPRVPCSTGHVRPAQRCCASST